MLIAAFIWGTTFVAQTTGMDTIGPFAFNTARYLIGAIALLPLALIERRKLIFSYICGPTCVCVIRH